jgi:hypothetical protein
MLDKFSLEGKRGIVTGAGSIHRESSVAHDAQAWEKVLRVILTGVEKLPSMAICYSTAIFLSVLSKIRRVVSFRFTNMSPSKS